MERYRTTLILLAVLIALGAAVFFLQSPSPTDTSTATPTPTTNLFGAGNSDPITALDVVSGTKRVSLRQEVSGTTWLLLEPIKSEAESFTVNNIADQLKTLQPATTMTQTTDLASYGLDKPGLAVTVKFEGGTPGEYKLFVGRNTPDMVYYYAKLDGKDSVYLISNSIVEPLKSWLDTPPIAQPTATPMPMTVLPPENTPTPTVVATPAASP